MKDLQKLQTICANVTAEIHGSVKFPEYCDKLYEECAELNAELSKDASKINCFEVADEMGDVMMCLARMAEVYKIDMYDCLHGALIKNVQRLKDENFKREVK